MTQHYRRCQNMNTLVEAETLSESWGKTSFKNWLKEVFRNKFQILWLVSELISVVGESTKTARKISRIYPVQQKVFNLASLELNQLKCLQKCEENCKTLQKFSRWTIKMLHFLKREGEGDKRNLLRICPGLKPRKNCPNITRNSNQWDWGFFAMFPNLTCCVHCPGMVYFYFYY